MTKTKWQKRAEQDPEYNELMFLRWYYHQIQMYVNQIPWDWKNKEHDTFQEWIIDYYEHPEWGSNYKLKVPESYRKAAANKSQVRDGRGYDWEMPLQWKIPWRDRYNSKITEDDK